ncbi:MAG: hypothetical protein JXB19_07970 [Bacteroidales bacterium]|nr:hypothetical protein [Bacteroidales bacterium]
MKTIAFGKAVLSGFILMICTFGLVAQETGYTRTIEREFAVDEQTRLEIDNIYGNVNVMNHDQNSISIEVTVRVNIRDKTRADEILKMVDISILHEDRVVRAITRINDNFSRLFRGFNIGGGGLEINYAVYMPPSVPLQLLNKYGNVFIDEITSTSVIDVKYGKLNAGRIIHDSNEPLTKIILAYSDAVIQEATWLNAEIKYSKINVTESKALVIVSKYSKIYITNGSSIVSDSKYDTFEFGDLSNFIVRTEYSNIKINGLSNRLQLDAKYTDVNVLNVPSGFENITINSSFGNIRVGIDRDASYQLDGYAKYCNIIFPENNSRVSRIDENNELKVNGLIGTIQNTKSKVTISSSYANVRLTK